MLAWLERWVTFCARHCVVVLFALAAVTSACGYLAVTKFSMNSDLGQLIRQDQPWRLDFDRYEAEFPHLVNTLVLVVAGDSRTQTDAVTAQIKQSLATRSDIFSRVSAPAVDPYLRQHALLYLTPDALDDVVDELAAAQPMLSAVAADPSLRSIFGLLADAVKETAVGTGLAPGTVTALRLLNGSAGALLEGDDPTLRWGDEFVATQGKTYRLVVAEGALDYEQSLPNAQLLATARERLAALQVPDNLSVMFTGEVALAHEEIQAALTGVQRAGWVSVVLLLIVLLAGVRSVKILLGIFLMLTTGVVWTSAYAMLAVGEYNTLSVVFLVMFFGLGIDFALHFSLRYQEAVNSRAAHGEIPQAMGLTTHSVGRAIGLCTLTTMIAFMGFWPTDYQGLADLGVISAGGMLVAALLTFTLLPAWYGLVGDIRPHVTSLPSSDLLVAALVRHKQAVLVVLAGVTLVAGWAASRTHFDYSVLALRDEASESMQALRLLQAQDLATDYSLAILASDADEYKNLADLEEVASVTTAADIVPAKQQEKIEILEDAQQILWNLFEEVKPVPNPTAVELQTVLSQLINALQAYAEPQQVVQQTHLLGGLTRSELRQIIDTLQDVQQQSPALLGVWQPAVVQPLVAELAWLRAALQVEPITFADLPRSVARNFRSANGQYLATVNPAKDLSKVEKLNQFIAAVHAQAPTATGRPVIELGVGQIVLDSFYTAMGIAALGVFLVLLATFRSLVEAALIMVPLALALLVTLAVGVWLDQPLNMANILVLPLIFGLGVDNGIHVVDRFRGAGNVRGLMHSSTPRAVMLSTLTTIGTFASLMLSPHQGTASIGFLLACAVSLVLLLTVFVLPVLLSLLVANAPTEPSGRETSG